MNTLYTIGYSSFEMTSFINTLQKHNINAIADVRSLPYSKFKPDFNREQLSEILKENSIRYVFLGNSCGARIKDPLCFINEKASYKSITETIQFKKGLSRIIKGLQKYTIALLCAEKDPINCHRNILICRNLKDFDIEIIHILESDFIERNTHSEERLLNDFNFDQNELFLSKDELLEEAYDKKIASIMHIDAQKR